MEPGHTLCERYLLERELGRGSVGVVFAGRDLLLDREIAIKLARRKLFQRGLPRWQHKLKHAATLEHPGLVTVYDFGVDPDFSFLVMPLLVGRSLQELFVVGPLPLRLVAKLGVQTARTMAYAHAKGLIHANLNPSHVMLVGGSEGLQVKLLDFGVAIDSDELRQRAQARLAAGMPSYIAPELHRADERVDARADLYSLGAILYEAVLGRPVLSSDIDLGRQDNIVDTRPLAPGSLRTDIPPAFESLLLRLLSPQPEQRPDSAQEIIAQLEPFVGETDRGGIGGELGGLGQALTGRELGYDASLEAGDARTALLQELIGRDRSLRAIDSRLINAQSGSAQMIMLAGEAGIGKTTLLDELALSCQRRQLDLLRTRATHNDSSSWKGPFTELLTAGLAQRPEAAELLAPYARQLLDVFPDLSRSRIGQLVRAPQREGSWAGLERLDDTGPARARGLSIQGRGEPGQSKREQLETLLARTFAALLASGRALTLAIDDAHLSEEVVELLAVLFHHLRDMPLVLVLAYEPAETPLVHAVNRLNLRLAQHPRVLNIVLDPLDEQAHERLLMQLLRHEGELEPGLAASLLRESGGRPLYARELVRAATEAEALVERDGIWRLESHQWPIPRLLSTSVRGRLRRLPPRLLDALRIGSVLAATARSFDFDELLTLCGDTKDELDYLLARGVERALLIEERIADKRSFTFTSQILQRITHEGLALDSRQTLHRHCAAYLRNLVFDEDLVEHRRQRYLGHLLEGNELAKAKPLVIERAQRALESADPTSEASLLSQIIHQLAQLLERGESFPSSVRGELLMYSAELQHHRGQLDAAAATLEQLIPLLHADDEQHLTPLGQRGNELANRLGRRDLGDRLLDTHPHSRPLTKRKHRAIVEIAALRPATESRSMPIGDLLLMHGDYTGARDAYDNARRRAAREGNRDEEARQLQRLARVSSQLQQYHSALSYCRSGLERLEGRHSLERVGLWALAAYAHCRAGFLDRAEGELEAARAELDSHPNERSKPRDRVAALLERSRGDWYMGIGQPQRAISAYERCVSLSPSSERWDVSVARYNLGRACASAGHLSRALREFERAASSKRAIADRAGLAWTQISRGAVHRDLGDVNASSDYLAEAQQIADDELNDPSLFASVHTELARHALLRGEVDRAVDEARRVKDMARGLAAAKQLSGAHELFAAAALVRNNFDEVRSHATKAIEEAEKHSNTGGLISALLLLAEVSPEHERPELLARARAVSERLANPYRELDVSLTSLRLGLGDPIHASDDYVALEELSDRAERLSARRHMGLCLLAQAEVLAPHDLRGALDHARLGETQLRVLGAKLEADRAARLIARLTAR